MLKRINLFTLLFITSLLWSFQANLISEFSTSNKYTNPQNGISISDNAYILGHRGIDIYDFSNDMLDKVGELSCYGITMSYAKDGDNIFWGNFDHIYSTNCEQPDNMEVINSLEETPARFMFTQNGFLYNHHLNNDYTDSIYKYDNNFNIVSIIEYEYNHSPLRKISDEIFFNSFNDYVMLHRFENDNVTMIDSIYIGNTSSPSQGSMVGDSLFAYSSYYSRFKIFELSTFGNAELVCEIDMPFNSFILNNRKLISFSQDNLYLYDLNELANPVLINTFHVNDYFKNVAVQDDKIIADTINGNVLLFKLENNQFILLDSNPDPGILTNFHYLNNNLYAYSYGDGFTCWDLNDINNPTKTFSFQHDLAAFINFSNNEILTTRKEGIMIDNWIPETLLINDEGIQLIDTLPGSSMYTKYEESYYSVFDGSLHKFEYINSEFTELQALDLDLLGLMGYIFFHDDLLIAKFVDTIAFVKLNSDGTMEHIYSSTINNSGIITYCSYENYIFISEAEPNSTTWIYDVADLNNIHFVAEIEDSGVLAVDEQNDLLFMGNWECTVYDISNIETGIFPEVGNFTGFGSSRKIEAEHRGNDNYLIYMENTGFRIYEYDDFSSNESNIIEITGSKINNYPNPFNPITTISFNIGSDYFSEELYIAIYNIKGQEVISYYDTDIQCIDARESEDCIGKITWDGRDYSNNQVASGIYLTTLKVGDRILASRKMLLLK